MQRIAGITRDSAKSAGETSEAVQDLVTLSQHLNSTIARFRI